MPMLNCPVCGRTVSDQAVACPGCGHPLKPVAAASPVAQGASGIAPVVGKVAGIYLIAIAIVAVVLFGGFFLLMGKLATG